jgi:hypothetical protein
VPPAVYIAEGLPRASIAKRAQNPEHRGHAAKHQNIEADCAPKGILPIEPIIPACIKSLAIGVVQSGAFDPRLLAAISWQRRTQ